MKKFMNKLNNAGSSNNSSSSSPSQHQRYSQPSGPPPQQRQQQQQQNFAAPPGPPPQQYDQQQQQYGGVAQQGSGYAPPTGPPHAGGGASMARSGGEDPFAALRRYDTVFVVDDSESMEMFWDETYAALIGVVEKCVQYDDDGIDIYFFNSTEVAQNVRTAQDVRGLFRRVEPRRSTPTARALKRVLDPYLVKLEANHRAKETGGAMQTVKPLNVVVLTDGAPDRNEEPEGVIVDAGKRLDNIRAPPYQLGFSFVQIGQDEEAQEALTYLDDHLKTEYGIRDMVDTTLSPSGGHVSSEYLLKALLGGVNRKLDKQ